MFAVARAKVADLASDARLLEMLAREAITCAAKQWDARLSAR